MKNKLIYIFCLVLTVSMTGCYDEPDWLGDNTTTEGKNFPVISGLSTTNGDIFKSNEVVNLDLDFWSDDDIAEIRLIEKIDGTERLVETYDYAPNFQEDSQTDELLMDYIVPPLTEETEIVLAVEIINENGLSRITPDPGSNTPSGTVNAVSVTGNP